ncbi:MAG TPA: phytanoyl-CoA dioxygenase family protein [Pyrinomonadaceae bacterium]
MDRLNQFKQNGFVLCKGFFKTPEIDLIRRQAQRVFALQMVERGISQTSELSEQEFEQGMFQLFDSDLQTFTNCGKHAQHLISLHRLALDERIAGVLHEFGLEFPSICTRPVLYFNSRWLATKDVYWKVEQHQDWRSMQGSLDAVVVWIPLVDIDRSVGALEVIPGSHKWGLLPADVIDGFGILREKVDPGLLTKVEVERGDALFFSAFLVHQSGVNTTDSIRWSCHFRYNNLSDPTFVARGFPHPYIYRPVEELLTPAFPTQQQVDELFGV